MGESDVNKIDRRIKHRMAGTSTYKCWGRMKERCLDKKHKSFKRYGGRGITICDRWIKFENFLADMGEKPDGLTLDRKDNDGNYTLENCQWSTPKQQTRNRSTSRLLTYKGVTKSMAQWADDLGIEYYLLRNRITKCKWTVERAFETPLMTQFQRL